MELESLGAKIREARKRLKLTQSDLAGSEFTKSFISQVEKGQTRPSLKSLQIIAERLNQPISFFLDEEACAPKEDRELVSLMETANHLHANGLLCEAAESYARTLDRCHPSDHALKAELASRLGRIYLRLEQYRKAVDTLTFAVEAYRHTSTGEPCARVLNDLGLSYFNLGRYHEARRCFEEAHEKLSAAAGSDPQLRLRVLCNLCHTLKRLALYGETVAYIEFAIRLSTGEGEYFKYGELCRLAGVVYGALGRHADALSYTDRAIHFFQAVGDRPQELTSMVTKAGHLRKLSRIDEAREVACQVLSQTDRPEYAFERAEAYAELGIIDSAAGDYGRALEHAQEALRLAPSHREAPEWMGIFVECAKNTALPPGLVDRLEQWIDDWEGPARDKAELHSSLGELYRLAGRTEKANEHLTKSVSFFRQA